MSELAVFRQDLKHTREEQQGVVYYRIEDPNTQTSFRLYEIEFLIAHKFDGTRNLEQVIKAVKDEFNFDISMADLERFVSQLESMGFMSKMAVPESTAAVASQPMEIEELDVIDDVTEITDLTDSNYDPEEEKRLLTNALLHVKQGYIPHARDYFLAAKEINPTNEKLINIINQMEIVGDDPSPVEVSFIWEQVQELFPELAEQIGAPEQTEVAPIGGKTQELVDEFHSGRRKGLIIGFLIFLLVGVGIAVWMFLPQIVGGTPQIKTTAIQKRKGPPVFSASKSTKTYTRKVDYTFNAKGPVAVVAVSKGQQVEKGSILAYLKLPGSAMKKLQKGLKKETDLKSKQNSLKKKQEMLEKEVQALGDKKKAALEEIKKMGNPKEKNARKKIKTIKKQLSKLNKQLKKQQKNIRKTKTAANKLKKQLLKQTKAIQKIMKKPAIKKKIIIAASSGIVESVSIQKGKKVTPKTVALTVVDPTILQIGFQVTPMIAKDFKPAMGAQVIFSDQGNTVTLSGTIEGIDVSDAKHPVINVKVSDTASRLRAIDAKNLKLGIPSVNEIFSVPVQAVFRAKSGKDMIWLVSTESVLKGKQVKVFSQEDGAALVSGEFKGGEPVAFVVADGSSLGEFAEETEVEVVP